MSDVNDTLTNTCFEAYPIIIFNDTSLFWLSKIIWHLIILNFSVFKLKEIANQTYKEICDIKDALNSPADPDISPDESENWSLVPLCDVHNLS